MLGLTPQERKIIQVLLVLLFIGLGVTVVKRMRQTKSFNESLASYQFVSHVDSTIKQQDSLFSSIDTTDLDVKAPTDTLLALSQFTGIVNINKAGKEELESLPGIGPSLAQRIIEYRENNVGFDTIDDLKNIKGIGTRKFERIKDFITIE